MSNIPSTYHLNFHGELESHPWLNKLPYRILGNTGLNLSLIGYGGSSLANYYGEIDKNEAIETIRSSIKAGINYLDTSPWYGASEDIIGLGLKDVPRNTYFIGTKAGRNYTPSWEGRFDFSGQAILRSVERSLQRLGLDYVDIIQAHDIEFCLDQTQILKETIPALESIVRAGKAKYIGITGYDLDCLKQIVDQTHVDTILSYCRYNFNDKSLIDYVPYFKEKNVGIINASPLSMGLFTTNGPPEWHPASSEVKTDARKACDLARTMGTSLEKISLGFSLRPKFSEIATTLVSIPTRKILEENLEVVCAAITPEDEDIYKTMNELFGNENRDWEGGDVEMYKEFVRNRK